jgi:pimeloyl-ACP methyl ester carboxylesterase
MFMFKQVVSFVLFVVASSLSASVAQAQQWQGSVELVVSGIGEAKKQIVSESLLDLSAPSFALEVGTYPVLSGFSRRRSLRVSTTLESVAWANSMAQRFGGDVAQLTKVFGRGSFGKRWSLVVSFSGLNSSSQKIRGRFKFRGIKARVRASADAIIDEQGGEVVSSRALLTVDPGFFSAPAQIDLRVQREPLSQALDERVISDTVVINFPASAVAAVTTEDVPGLRLKRSLPAKTAKAATIQLPKNALTRINIIRLDPTGSGATVVGDQILLFGSPNADLLLPANAFTSLGPGVNGSTIRVESNTTDLQAYVDQLAQETLNLFHWDETDQDFTEIVEMPFPPIAEQVVILLHGWRPQGEESDEIDSQFKTWLPLLHWATNSTGASTQWQTNRAAFEFYSVRYNSTRSVFQNAVDIQKLLAEKFSDREVVLLGHSMGGLIGHVMFQKYKAESVTTSYDPWSNGGIVRLVTLGGPLHGSPLPQIIKDEVSCGQAGAGPGLVDFFGVYLKLETAGARSLRWDGFDGHLDTIRNEELYQLNANLSGDLSNYRTFAGTLGAAYHWPPYRWGDNLMRKCDPAFAGDGVVPETSAHLKGFVDGVAVSQTHEVDMSATGTDFDHSQLWGGRFTNQPDSKHFDAILAELDLTPKPAYQWEFVFDNSFGVGDGTASHVLEPARVVTYAQGVGLTYYTKCNYAYIRPASGDRTTVAEIDVGIGTNHSGQVGGGVSSIHFFDPSNIYTAAFVSPSGLNSTGTFKLKTNFRYLVEVNAVGTAGGHTHEMIFTFPMR